MKHGARTQDEIVDNLSLYLADIVLLGDHITTEEQRAHLDGVITGMAIAVAIAAGSPGPTTGDELARVGADLAQAVTERISAERGTNEGR